MTTKEVIKSRGFTVKRLAEMLGKNYQSLNDGLNKGQVSLTGLREIAAAIGCRVGDFFADEASCSPSAPQPWCVLSFPAEGRCVAVSSPDELERAVERLKAAKGA